MKTARDSAGSSTLCDRKRRAASTLTMSRRAGPTCANTAGSNSSEARVLGESAEEDVGVEVGA